MNPLLKKLLLALKNNRIFENKPEDIENAYFLKSELDEFLGKLKEDKSSETQEMLNIIEMARKDDFDAKSQPYSRKLLIKPKTINEENRTAEFVLATDTPVRVFDWNEWEFVNQVLSFKKSHIVWDRMKNGAPFLNTHKRYDISFQIGVIEEAWTEENQLIIRVRFSKREDVEWIWQDVIDGIIRNVSVGFIAHDFKEITKKDDDMRTLQVVKWEPMEGSIVPVGADPNAQIRSKNIDVPIKIKNNENTDNKTKSINRGKNMFEFDEKGNLVERKEDGTIVIIKTVGELSKRFETGVSEEDKIKILEAERKRVHEIKRCCEIASVKDSEKFINSDKNIDEIRKEIFSEIEERNKDNKINPSNGTISVGTQNKDMRRKLMTDAILLRGLDSKKGVEINPEAKMYRGLTLIRMAEEILRSEGVSTGLMTNTEIARRAFNTSSDFPLVLQDAINKTVRSAYNAETSTHEPIATRRTASDFKTLHSMQFGGAINMEEVLENGEFKQDSLSESDETYKIKKYGKKIAVTEELIINDDMRVLTRLPQLYGESAKRLEGDLIWAQIISNPNMADGTALFHADHGNLAGASVISVASIGELRKFLRLQKGLETERLSLGLKYLIVPATLETVAEQFISTIQPTDSAKVNPFTGMKLIVEPRLDDDSTSKWYASANKSQIDIVEWAVLEGMENGPEVVSWQDYDRDGFMTRIKYTLAAKSVDHRGITRNG